MSAAEIVLVGGGVRSGKSAFALHLARGLGARRVFVATAQAFDREMEERIAAHHAERGGAFLTVEEPLDLAGALERADADVVVVDCLTLWISNLLLRGDGAAAVAAQVEAVAGVLARRRVHAVLVTNEVGMGVVPESALGRAFRDAAGRAHQRLARDADRIYLATLGCVLRLRPGPLTLIHPETPP
ncbi:MULTISPECIES: bifunctional adenosylcobinamide kinase/adenosylcobinamide-phosphate guanylyltransferase [Anaeromyxobacter]|uniref:bifunctional adenosylcobinamide kinase/adenosylcobinamide-phosphate guanylyltransferase n=1 Tax=Anaeromyxobacter TaxID=161492 RepID=UPI001F58E4C2|nr:MULTISPECIES: bifunctional adenosylcobinamide kinase/adenosylcobinamide-phosphate guanylyltransferase [unclassified Anaeromyxobacter]